MKVLVAILLIVLATASAATFRVDPSSGFFMDEVGRVRIFHGVNVVYKVPPFLPQTSAFDPFTSLTEDDMRNLTNWGFNVVRLGIFWSALEPSPGVFNDTYLTSVKSLVDALGRHGIYTILDFHQDLYTRRFCGNGFPDWAAITSNDSLPFALPVTLIPTDNTTGVPALAACESVPNFALLYLSEQVNEAFGNFYANTFGVQDKFVDFWSRVSAAFHNSTTLLSYEIINEPWPGDIYRNPAIIGTADATNLVPLYTNVTAAIRKNDPSRIVFFEKALTDILSDSGFDSLNATNMALSYHAQCTLGLGNIFPDSIMSLIERMRFRDPEGEIRHLTICDLFATFSIQSATRDSHKLGVGIFLSEFGASQNLSTVELIAESADALMQSWTYWQYKFFNDLTTTAGRDEGLYNSTGALNETKVRLLSRTYAQAIAGIPLFSSFNVTTGVFTMQLLVNRDITSPTIIYLNEAFYYPRGFRVTFDPPTAASFSSPAGNLLHISYSSAVVTGSPLKITIVPI